MSLMGHTIEAVGVQCRAQGHFEMWPNSGGIEPSNLWLEDNSLNDSATATQNGISFYQEEEAVVVVSVSGGTASWPAAASHAPTKHFTNSLQINSVYIIITCWCVAQKKTCYWNSFIWISDLKCFDWMLFLRVGGRG